MVWCERYGANLLIWFWCLIYVVPVSFPRDLATKRPSSLAWCCMLLVPFASTLLPQIWAMEALLDRCLLLRVDWPPWRTVSSVQIQMKLLLIALFIQAQTPTLPSLDQESMHRSVSTLLKVSMVWPLPLHRLLLPMPSLAVMRMLGEIWSLSNGPTWVLLVAFFSLVCCSVLPTSLK